MVAGSTRKGVGSWNESAWISGTDRAETSATGWPSTSIPTASRSTTPLMRGEPSNAISAAIQPPTELPMTVTFSSPRSSSKAL
jgi:hypothetical protein